MFFILRVWQIIQEVIAQNVTVLNMIQVNRMADTICLCWASYELIKIHMSFSDPYEQYPPTAILIYTSIKIVYQRYFASHFN